MRWKYKENDKGVNGIELVINEHTDDRRNRII